MIIEVKNSLKTIDYAESMKILEKRVDDVFSGKKPELIWVLEHNPVYTAGTSAKDTDLLDKSINVIKTNRGGKHTYHGPGQKVVYFVIDLNKRGKDIRKFITKIENCIIDVLAEYRIQSFPDKKNIGIWVNNNNKIKKIAAIGIKVKKWIAYHGFALNVCSDLSKYKKIIPCGVKDKDVTNLKDLTTINYNNIERTIVKKFLSTFP
tara:strand:- start:1892 stop:2509 length:618 start_codon:yes stop_codon:yes gene_type:complete